jgi:hypothetical protein
MKKVSGDAPSLQPAAVQPIFRGRTPAIPLPLNYAVEADTVGNALKTVKVTPFGALIRPSDWSPWSMAVDMLISATLRQILANSPK